MRNLKNMDFSPRSITKNINKDELKSLLSTKIYSYWKGLFCWHNWVYWRFGKAQKLHRVCKKCGKKQQNGDVLNTYDIWVKERHF